MGQDFRSQGSDEYMSENGEDDDDEVASWDWALCKVSLTFSFQIFFDWSIKVLCNAVENNRLLEQNEYDLLNSAFLFDFYLLSG